MSVMLKNAVTFLFSLVLLAIITILIVITIHPISLPYVSNLVKDELDNRFHAYYIDFDTVQTRWRPIKGTIEFHINSARALDYGKNLLAFVPKVLVEISIDSIFRNTVEFREIKFQNPKISFIRTIGGALKFDIGNSNDGSSGRILETILINVAIAPVLYKSESKSQTKLHILNSNVTLGDEVSGSLLHIQNANITLMPNVDGVQCTYDLIILARSENIHISGVCLYNTASENINLIVNLDKIRPALLTEISPYFLHIIPLEVRLSGKVVLELDKLLSVNSAEFDLVSEKGSFEVSEYIGNNLSVNKFKIVGKVFKNFSRIEIDNLMMDLEHTKVEANALFLRNNNNLDIKLKALFTGTSTPLLLPRWFEYLKNENLYCIDPSTLSTYKQSMLAIDGTYNLNQHQISALGHISCLNKKITEDDTKSSSSAYFGARTNAAQKFAMEGTLDSLNLTIIE